MSADNKRIIFTCHVDFMLIQLETAVLSTRDTRAGMIQRTSLCHHDDVDVDKKYY